MVFGTQLVGAQRVQEAHASAEVEGTRYTIDLAANETGDATHLKEMFLNNIFNRAQLDCKFTQIGRKFFDIGTKQQVDPEQGISTITGFSSAIHVREDEANQQRIFVEVDTTTKVYFDGTVLETMNKMRDKVSERDLRNAILNRFKNR
jgi:hypothetical protein